MTPFSDLSRHPIIHFLGWTLLHSVWIGAILGAAVWFFLKVSTRLSASMRHTVCFLFLLLLPVSACLAALVFHSESFVATRRVKEVASENHTGSAEDIEIVSIVNGTQNLEK